MDKILGEFQILGDDGLDCKLLSHIEKDGIETYDFEMSWTSENSEKNSKFTFKRYIPILEHMYRWSPLCYASRHVNMFWLKRESALAYNAPIESFHNLNGTNRLTWAISEAAKHLVFGTGVTEEDATLQLRFEIGVNQYTGKNAAKISVRLDTRAIPMHEAVNSVVDWWANDCGMTPAYVPESAKDPAYSFWYSYHKDLKDVEIEAECRRAKDIGFDVCIVDDGWQSDENERDYSHCGDWKPAKSKIADMAAHVKRVHDIGMKYILWYSVPFVGPYTESYEHLKDMMLRPEKSTNTFVVDPRYKEVREFLKDIYKKAIIEWDLDGLKLDFIDMWRPHDENAPVNDKMDIVDLQEAVDTFMTEVMQELKAIKNDILLEFRQCYIGPNMRKYGNMFRVGDCPNDFTKNRLGVLDLRLHMGNTAVHSDMLMWHIDEKPEVAAIQIINIMFGVMQYSAKLSDLTDDMKRMSKFWLTFLKEHKKLLLDAKVVGYQPEFLNTWAKTCLDNECAIGLYCPDVCVKPDNVDTVYIANGTQTVGVLAETQSNYTADIYNCMGELVANTAITAGINKFDIPVGGLAILKK